MNRARVTDFGLAAVLLGLALPQAGDDGKEIHQTQLTRGIVGTPLYMAPEQWLGEPVSAAADIYALGLILFEMLTGERAVAGRTLEELRQAHTAGRLQPWRGSVPGGVRAMVERCLARRPADRYADWAQAAQALAESYAELAGQAVPVTEAARALERSERVALGWAQSALGGSYLDIGKTDVALGYFERARAVGRQKGSGSWKGQDWAIRGVHICNRGTRGGRSPRMSRR